MYWAALLEPSLFNQSPLSCKIGYLANPLKNSIFTSAVLLAVASGRSRLRAAALAPLVLLSLLGSHSAIPALTNTLFTIHPPLLYLYTGLTIRAVLFSERRLALAYLFLWAVSMFLGGFWSMQELSWGGWWNWDVIECGIAYQWAVVAALVHTSFRGSSLAASGAVASASCALTYTMLNKLGVGVSIHSFVTSAVTQNHYGFLIGSLSAAIVIGQTPGLATAAGLTLAMLGLYCGSRSFSIVKPALVFALWLAPYAFGRRPAILLSHRTLAWAAWAIAFSNYYNYSFFFTCSPRRSLLSLDCPSRFWGVGVFGPARQKIIWDGFWLSKPRYSLSSSLESWSTRSVLLRSAYSAFLK